MKTANRLSQIIDKILSCSKNQVCLKANLSAHLIETCLLLILSFGFFTESGDAAKNAVLAGWAVPTRFIGLRFDILLVVTPQNCLFFVSCRADL